jgi:hypothetical protein
MVFDQSVVLQIRRDETQYLPMSKTLMTSREPKGTSRLTTKFKRSAPT